LANYQATKHKTPKTKHKIQNTKEKPTLESKLVKPNTWVYVIVQDPGPREHFLGQVDEETGIQFIPAFLEKDAATMSLGQFKRRKGSKYEVQAILFEDLGEDAVANGFQIFILNDEGEVQEQINS
jgi:hypothetical protein